MKIAHISDIHIRNLKFHVEYRKVFGNFYDKLDELGVDLVVNTGDTAHTKTNISPEFVDMTSELFVNIAERAPLVSVLGNHDLNLMNEDRQDAISPIVEALGNDRIVLLKKSGLWQFKDFSFHNFGISDVENWPRGPYSQDNVNIGLFHGSVKNCVTDSNFRMTDTEYDTSIFEGLDFVMMGDIHKRQDFNDGRIWYAGSMIQQNFGEDPEKGFILWDIKDRNNWDVTFHELKGNRRFYTVYLPDSLTLPERDIEPGSRIRISPQRPMTLVEQRSVEKLVRKKWLPHDVITLGVKNIGQTYAEIDGLAHRIENLRDISVQENLLQQYLEPRDLDPVVMDKIIDINRKYQVSVEQKETVARGVNWKIKKMGWNNLYNYGEGNIIDFSHVRGVTGIFAPNASGKSSMIDVITVGTWDCNTKEVQKNIHLVNDNKDNAAIILEMSANGEDYTIQRQIDRIKYDKKKGNEKEWGKTSLEFYRHDKDGGLEKLVGELRPQTEANIARRFGTFDDFMLTGLFAQWDPMDLIMCKETERKRILFRFLDLDIFEDKAKLAKEDYKEWVSQLDEFENNNYDNILATLEEEQRDDEIQLDNTNKLKQSVEDAIHDNHTQIELLAAQITPVLFTFSKIEPNVLTKFENEIASHAKKLDAKIAQLKKQQLEHASVIEELSDYNAEYVNKQVEKLEELEALLSTVQANIREKEQLSQEKKKQSSLLERVPCGDSFPDCQFLVNAFEAKRELPEQLKEIIELELEAQRLRGEILKLIPYRDAKLSHGEKVDKANEIARSIKITKLESDNINLTIEKMEAELRESRLEIERYELAKKDLERNDVLQHEILEVKQKLAENEKALRGVDSQLAEIHQRMGARNTDAARIKKQLETIKTVKDTCSAYEHFLDAMGKDGIALQVLTQKLPFINEEINKILSSAAEFGVYIEYEPDNQSIRLYIQYGQYKSRLLELGSGAEKFLASVAIRSALLSISNLPRSNMFIIDEGFGKLDPQNLEAVQRMFDYLRTVFDHVIVISHTDIMKDMVDNMIEITTDDEGYAHVEIGG